MSVDQGAMTVDHVVATGQVCEPTGKHAKHAGFACTACHQCAGTVSFDAIVAGPTAAFDAVSKNCSSVKCHSVPSGTFSYYFPGGDGEPVLNTVSYGGSAGSGTANWYDTSGSSCSACHGFPPTYNGFAYSWHSGAHGGGNNCQLCHPDATGSFCAPNTGCTPTGTITNAALHGNGVVNVSASFRSSCFGCH